MDETASVEAEAFIIRPSTAPLCVRDAGPGKGRGVFALAPIASGTPLEVAPVLVFSGDEWDARGQHTMLAHYTFNWPGGRQAVCLGTFGSMWNHDQCPNVGFMRNIEQNVIVFSAIRDIAAGDECCISYGPRLWFDDAAATAREPASSDDDSVSAEEALAAMGGVISDDLLWALDHTM